MPSRPSVSTKEQPRMFKRLLILVSCCAVLALLGAVSAAAASAAPSPWWQVLTGSRPTNLWIPEDNVQEIETEIGEQFGFEGVAARIEVNGETVGCLGTANFGGEFLCNSIGYAPIEKAEELEALLETVFGTSSVEVTGGPVGGDPFLIAVADRGAPPIKTTPLEVVPGSEPPSPFGSAKARLLQAGGSGRLVLTITNLGDAPVDATDLPVRIEDELPAGVIATSVEAFAGARGEAGPVDCSVEASGSTVVCTFEDVLDPYEAIEVEVSAALTGEPPTPADPGKVTVSGGSAPMVVEAQPLVVSPEKTSFGLERFSARTEEEGGHVPIGAGSHPFQMTSTFQFNAGPMTPAATRRDSIVEQPGLPRNVRFTLPAGLIGNPTQVPTCELPLFYGDLVTNDCPDEAAIGVASVTIVEPNLIGFIRFAVPVFNLPPAVGEPARFGFTAGGAPVVINTEADPDNEYRLIATVSNATQGAQLLSSTVVIWGSPGDSRHDGSRGWNCVYFEAKGPCGAPFNFAEAAFLREPVSCGTPRAFTGEVEPWNTPLGSVVSRASSSIGPLAGCNQVPFEPIVSGAPTSKLASNPSGFDFQLSMPNKGLVDKDEIAEAQPKKVEVTLPQGMTINPSQGDGLLGCSPADYARETATSPPGAGCPNASKVGDVQVSTPLLEEEARGALYVASPRANPFGSLLALYMVAKIPERGILIKQAGLVKPDPVTGQLVTVFDDLPQLPFDTFKLHFREGARAPLSTPSACGKYQMVARFTPWSAANPENPAPSEVIEKVSEFEVERGANGGACPGGGVPPFKPDLLAGTINNAAGEYSPFNLRLTRNDGEQEFTHFSIKLPPGVIGKLAGIPFCSDAAIAAAKARTGPNGGQEELDSPSCPADSQVGRTLVGAGVGPSPVYVPGRVYLAGPYNGAPLSVVAITAAKVGPFDLGTVVVRQALRINPETAEVFVDATGSDPIPHIIQGIPVHARDIRVYVDRPEFVLNPTSCERTSTAATVLGSGLDFGSTADNVPVTVTTPFQAADCASLGFKPRLQLSLKGKTRRGGNPALKAVFRPRMGNANTARISVALPRSEFLDQGHIRTVCTRVQFKAGAGNGTQCPRGAIYGRAKAWTPLLDEPLEGPVFLRSSENPLPDMVLALRGLVDVHAVGRIDSVNGGIRSTFDFVPDAPLTKVVLEMAGGKRSLLENSTNICRGKHNATVKMKGHNGRVRNFQAPLKASCGKARKQSQRSGQR
jgi:hypothetical protein